MNNYHKKYIDKQKNVFCLEHKIELEYDKSVSGYPCKKCIEHDQAIIRLEELRQSINDENISYGELAELQSLADHIEAGDVQLLEWAGVPEQL